MDQEQLDRIEEKLDKLIELLQAWNRFTTFDYMATYPRASDEEVYIYPWQQSGTSLSP